MHTFTLTIDDCTVTGENLPTATLASFLEAFAAGIVRHGVEKTYRIAGQIVVDHGGKMTVTEDKP